MSKKPLLEWSDRIEIPKVEIIVKEINKPSLQAHDEFHRNILDMMEQDTKPERADKHGKAK